MHTGFKMIELILVVVALDSLIFSCGAFGLFSSQKTQNGEQRATNEFDMLA